MTAFDLRMELTRIVEAVQVLSPTSFVFAGRPFSHLMPTTAGTRGTPGTPPLMDALVAQLYYSCFSHRFRGAVVDPPAASLPHEPDWISLLSQANQSRERWEDGWIVMVAMPNGQLLAQRGATARMLSPGDFITAGTPGMLPSAGAPVRVYFPRESSTLQPGFYFVFGETAQDASDDLSMVRFYWNVSIEAASDLLRLISAVLNRWQIPFRLKILSHRVLFGRADAAVLYVPRRCAHIAHELLVGIYPQMRTRLHDEVPLFTLPLAAGLAFAEDPGSLDSFGLSRCRILAEGLWWAHTQGAGQTQQRVAIVEEQFRSRQISLERPWLNAGSADDYQFGAVAS